MLILIALSSHTPVPWLTSLTAGSYPPPHPILILQELLLISLRPSDSQQHKELSLCEPSPELGPLYLCPLLFNCADGSDSHSSYDKMQVMCEGEATCRRIRNYSLVQTAGRIQTLFAQQYLSEINHTDPAWPGKTTRTMGKAVCALPGLQSRTGIPVAYTLPSAMTKSSSYPVKSLPRAHQPRDVG